MRWLCHWRKVSVFCLTLALLLPSCSAKPGTPLSCEFEALLGVSPGILSLPWGTKNWTLTLLKSEDWWKWRHILAKLYTFSLTCNLFWTFNLWTSVEFLICRALCSVETHRVPLKAVGPFILKETSLQEEKEDQPVSTRLSNSWKRRYLKPDIAKAWSISMYMASFESLFSFLGQQRFLAVGWRLFVLLVCCSSTLTKWTRAIPTALSLDCFASTQFTWKALAFLHTLF